MEIEDKAKKIIEENPVAVATVNGERPHVIAAAYVKVKDNKIVLTNNYMKTTLDNINDNSNVSLAVWNKDWKGYRIDGSAEYFTEGEWYDFVKEIPENKDEPCNGAIVIEVTEIMELG